MMTQTIPWSSDAARPFSLMLTLRAVTHRAGCDVDIDDLSAALGLSWMVCAVPGDSNLARWPMYARDAFLIEAGRLFGLGIREIHPPEAARGLSNASEFRQHFDASYRPLLRRAVDNGQAVLAWRGWPDHREMMWGLITRPCEEGVGFAGVTFSSSQSVAADEEMVLEKPPIQLYVVETANPVQPDPYALWRLSLDHVLSVLANELAERFGVLTGPAAYNAWIDRLRRERAAGPPESDSAVGHNRLAAYVVAAHQSTLRFLDAQLSYGTPRQRGAIEVMVHGCRKIVTSLEEYLELAAVRAMSQTTTGREKLIHGVAATRDATATVLSRLEAQTPRAKAKYGIRPTWVACYRLRIAD